MGGNEKSKDKEAHMQKSKPAQVPVSYRRRQNRARGCKHQREHSLDGMTRTVIDDSGSLAITAWTCADCEELIEEIYILSRYGRERRSLSQDRYRHDRDRHLKELHTLQSQGNRSY